MPHVLGVQVGQPMVVRNSDPEIHNVHFAPDNSPARNLTLANAGQSTTVSVDTSEASPVGVDCANHSWMTAYLGVFPHPFFATTGPDGRFEIGRVPPLAPTRCGLGTSGWGRSSRRSSCRRRGTVAADLTFARAG